MFESNFFNNWLVYFCNSWFIY